MGKHHRKHNVQELQDPFYQGNQQASSFQNYQQASSYEGNHQTPRTIVGNTEVSCTEDNGAYETMAGGSADPFTDYGYNAQAEFPSGLSVFFPANVTDQKRASSWWYGCIDKNCSPGNLITDKAAKSLGITSYMSTSKTSAYASGSKIKIKIKGTIALPWRGIYGTQYVNHSETKFYVVEKQPYEGYDVIVVKGWEPMISNKYPAAGQEDLGYEGGREE